MSNTNDKLTSIVRVENLRFLLGVGQLVAIVGGTWMIATSLSNIRHDISDVRSVASELRAAREEDRQQMKELGHQLVAAINRITAIEARTEPRRN